MNGDSVDPGYVPVEWPPPLASRAVRRHCTHQVKAGYCAYCGTKETK